MDDYLSVLLARGRGTNSKISRLTTGLARGCFVVSSYNMPGETNAPPVLWLNHLPAHLARNCSSYVAVSGMASPSRKE